MFVTTSSPVFANYFQDSKDTPPGPILTSWRPPLSSSVGGVNHFKVLLLQAVWDSWGEIHQSAKLEPCSLLLEKEKAAVLWTCTRNCHCNLEVVSCETFCVTSPVFYQLLPGLRGRCLPQSPRPLLDILGHCSFSRGCLLHPFGERTSHGEEREEEHHSPL